MDGFVVGEGRRSFGPDAGEAAVRGGGGYWCEERVRARGDTRPPSWVRIARVAADGEVLHGGGGGGPGDGFDEEAAAVFGGLPKFANGSAFAAEVATEVEGGVFCDCIGVADEDRHCAEIDGGVIFYFAAGFLDCRIGVHDKFGEDFEAGGGWVPVEWEFGLFFKEDVVVPGVVFPVDEEVGFETIEGVGPENGVRWEELGGDGRFDGGEGDGLAGGGVGELDGANAAADAFAVPGLNVENGLGV